LIEGIVTEDGVPAIKVEVANQRWQAIIDTGFLVVAEVVEHPDHAAARATLSRLVSSSGGQCPPYLTDCR
jgi:hypothetical protein